MPLHILVTELDGKLRHIRDGALRIMNSSSDRDARVIATNVHETAKKALRVLQEA